MTEHHKSKETCTVGDCSVCAKALPVGANHAYTVCKHLFCISCLLKWHKASPRATCPMCRAPFYEDAVVQAEEEEAEAEEEEAEAEEEEAESEEAEEEAEEAESEEAEEEAEEEEEAVQETAAQGTWMTLQEMDFTDDELSMHDNMMHIVNAHAQHYCRNNPTCSYMGTNNLCTIPNRENDYNGIEVGAQNLNCHYIIELRNFTRYKFGRIEDIRAPHPMFQGISWFVFRELVKILDDDTGHAHTAWSPETQLIVIQGGYVKSLRQYVPRMRMSI